VRARASLRGVLAVGALVGLCALFIAAGNWQWRRADEARATAELFGAGSAALPLTSAPPDLDDEALRFRRVELVGAYLPERQFLLDNMLHDGAAGYHALTPFAMGGGRWLLVNRGWLPTGPDRNTLPDLAVGDERRAVRGRLERLPKPGMRLADGAPHERAPVTVLSYPTAAELAELLGHEVFDYQLLLDAAEPDGFTRDWTAPGLAPERHLMYAGQWWLFALGAAAAAVGVIVIGARRERRHEN
jgi:surfeit locus 1 family protein